MNNLKKRINNQLGLTLIELLAVIVILGIIAGIAVPSIGSIIQKSKEDAVKADALQTLLAARLYSAATETASNTISSDDLSSYIENVKLGVYTVLTDSANYALITSDVPAGNATITFACATKEEISADNGKETRIIGSCGDHGTELDPNTDIPEAEPDPNTETPDTEPDPDTELDPEPGEDSGEQDRRWWTHLWDYIKRWLEKFGQWRN
ncbi:prepilin-type N-terminal cleavage/methylation domain-containing protein [Peribacillus saganii]|uniref:Prepilin-type N-terminal cleavage/methylation domain-containing protein n=1 Tax=Peribacillus saganii TaxID=2303992 RepID=A0A372LPV2_9BACI|nr:type II secretion system protein [Peribacillus saganii]RFU69351.1 prepilin-type N-terminal cleavage/methylation domain-containing protein [Peribacillus saganii]